MAAPLMRDRTGSKRTTVRRSSPAQGTHIANVLVVDDRPDKLTVVSALLEPLGQNVVVAQSGEQALWEMLEREFAVVLLDVNMPGMDGLETAALIRERRKTALTPIIFITAYADELHMARGYSLGAVDYILTPIVPQVLRSKVKVFVDLYLMQARLKDQASARVALAREQAARAAAEEVAERLQEADARKNEFLAMLSHELRNPMGAIRSATEVIKSANGDRESVKFASDVIDRQSRQLARLVDDLLDISRIARGKIELRTEEFDLVQAAQSGIETNRYLVNSKHLTMAVSLPNSPVRMHGDYARVVQIVANLVHNAATYTMPRGDIRISVDARHGEAEIRVSDSGIGIPADKLEDIFEPFIQLSPTAERAPSGLGIGLALVKTLTELHGGTVCAYSNGAGAGSEFVVQLPLLETPDTTHSGRPPGQRAATRGKPTKGSPPATELSGAAAAANHQG
jgi:signal transduction histidine kinase